MSKNSIIDHQVEMQQFILKTESIREAFFLKYVESDIKLWQLMIKNSK